MIIATPYLWLFVFFFIPFLIIVWISLGKTYPASPPFIFKPEFPWIYWEGYQRLFTDDLYIRAYLVSVYNAGLATALCLLVIAVRYASFWLGGVMLLYAAQFSLHAFYLVTSRPIDIDHVRKHGHRAPVWRIPPNRPVRSSGLAGKTT